MTCQIRSIVAVSGKKKLWVVQIGEELKKSGKFHCFFYCAFGIYSHSIITEVLIINK